MLLFYLRSSMVGSYEFCQHKTFLIYNIGLSERGNPKTNFGTATHKALELLAQKKLADQNGLDFIENDIFTDKYPTSKIDIDSAFNLGWDYCAKQLDYHDWSEKDKKKYYDMYLKCLNFRNGQYNPLKRHILDVEQQFDLPLDYEWAKYSYTINGQRIEGNVRLKGTIDLVTQEDDIIESADWKTGSKRNWSRGEWHNPKTKEYEDFKDDFQLLLYYYAMSEKYQTEDIVSTIYYLQDGGPYQVHFGHKAKIKALEAIKEYVLKIKSTIVPSLTKDLGTTPENFYNNKKCGWCDFNKVNPEYSDKKTICEFFRTQIVNLGLNKVIDKYGKTDKIKSYNVGGGRGISEKGK
jgi:CRISPR/Cas system-associated exonuclease Cas4 (RecB family)